MSEHPTELSAYQLAGGDLVLVVNTNGRCSVRLQLTSLTREASGPWQLLVMEKNQAEHAADATSWDRLIASGGLNKP